MFFCFMEERHCQLSLLKLLNRSCVVVEEEGIFQGFLAVVPFENQVLSVSILVVLLAASLKPCTGLD